MPPRSVTATVTTPDNVARWQMPRCVMAIGSALVAGLAISCSEPHPDSDRLPSAAIGSVTLGPGALLWPDTARSVVVMFDADGDDVGRVTGGPIEPAQTITWRNSLTTANADAVITLTPDGVSQVPIDENMIDGVAQNQETSDAMFWFNTGRPNGPSAPYLTTYVMVSPDAAPVIGTVPGTLSAAAHCGQSAYGLVVDLDERTAGDVHPRFYELPRNGSPTVRKVWEPSEALTNLFQSSVCAPDGSAIYNIVGSTEAFSDDAAVLSLMRIDTRTGERHDVPIDMAGLPCRTTPGTLTVVDNRLFWITDRGTVLSVPIHADTPTVRQEWSLPTDAKHHHESVSGEVVASVTYDREARYSEFDLRTGRVVRTPIELPWLSRELTKHTQSTVVDVSAMPR